MQSDVPSCITDTKDVKRAASETDENVQVLKNDAQKAEKERDAAAAGGLDGVAALERLGVTLARGLRRGGRRGDSDGSGASSLRGGRTPRCGDRKEREGENRSVLGETHGYRGS